MTGQISDDVQVRGRTYQVAAVEGEGLFDAAREGFDLTPPHTACWRGFVCHYVIRDEVLLLDGLDASTAGDPPQLDGTAPARRKDEQGFWRYRDLARPVRFTGTLLLGAEPAPGRPYLHMGFLPAWHFLHVLDVRLEAGRVVRLDDRSADGERVRRRAAENPPGHLREDEIPGWIEETFSLGRGYSLPDDPPPPDGG